MIIASDSSPARNEARKSRLIFRKRLQHSAGKPKLLDTCQQLDVGSRRCPDQDTRNKRSKERFSTLNNKGGTSRLQAAMRGGGFIARSAPEKAASSASGQPPGVLAITPDKSGKKSISVHTGWIQTTIQEKRQNENGKPINERTM